MSALRGLVVLGFVAACHATPHQKPPDSTASSVIPSSEPVTRETPARTKLVTARFINQYSPIGVLWAGEGLLGAFEYATGTNTVIVTVPRHEEVACAAWSDDGSLIGAVTRKGSVALWNREGLLLSELPGTTAPEFCDAFSFAPATRRMFAIHSDGRAALLGDGLAIGLETTRWAKGKFSSNGERLYASLKDAHVTVFDAVKGNVLGELAGNLESFTESEDGRFFALEVGEAKMDAYEKVGLYETATLRLLQTVGGQDPLFALDMLIVRVMGAPKAMSSQRPYDSVAYRLEPFKKRWQRPQIAIYDEPRKSGTSIDRGPWRVGMSAPGYSVFDARTGATLASWGASGYGCGYEWVWERGTLLFIEGDRLTWWNEKSGAKTQGSHCNGALEPVFSRDRSRVIGLDGIWDVRTRRRLVHIETRDISDLHFNADETLVVGRMSIGNETNDRLAAWSASTGQLVWQVKGPDIALSDHLINPIWSITQDERFLGFLDASERRFLWVGNVIQPERGVEQLVYDSECWDGPGELPAGDALPEGVPTRKCEGLLQHLAASVRANGAKSRN